MKKTANITFRQKDIIEFYKAVVNTKLRANAINCISARPEEEYSFQTRTCSNYQKSDNLTNKHAVCRRKCVVTTNTFELIEPSELFHQKYLLSLFIKLLETEFFFLFLFSSSFTKDLNTKVCSCFFFSLIHILFELILYYILHFQQKRINVL